MIEKNKWYRAFLRDKPKSVTGRSVRVFVKGISGRKVKTQLGNIDIDDII